MATSTGPLRAQRAPEDLGAARGLVEGGRKACDRAVRELAAQLRARGALHGDVVLAREQQDRAAIAEGLRDRGEGRLGARPVLHRARDEALAVGHACKAVGDVDRDPLGTRDDRAHADHSGGVEQAVLREADDRLGALALQQLDDAVGDEIRHCAPPSRSRPPCGASRSRVRR
jgi:hypothetical protein